LIRVEKLPPKQNLRPTEVAEFLDCNLDTVYRMIHDGVIPAVKLGKHYRIPRDKFLEAYEKHLLKPDRSCFSPISKIS
jgi:excisionase family DNA binding protein